MSNTICGNNTICSNSLIVGYLPNISLDLSTLGLPVGIYEVQMQLSDDELTKLDSDLSNIVYYGVYSITSTLNNVSASSSNPTTIETSGTVALTYTANEGYELPDSISVTGATGVWNKSTGVLTLSNPTGNVSFTINGIPVLYSITASLTNVVGASSNPTTIVRDGTATLTFTADTLYELPDNITVSGATYSWDKTTGTLILSNPTSNVNITIVATLQQWQTPTIALSDVVISTDYVDGVTKYKVYDNGEYIGWIDADNAYHPYGGYEIDGSVAKLTNDYTTVPNDTGVTAQII